MLTHTYISKGKFGLVEKPKPTIQQERDVIVKVTLAKNDEAYELFENKRDGVINVAVECYGDREV